MKSTHTFLALCCLLVLRQATMGFAQLDDRLDGLAALDRMVAGRAVLHTGRLRISVTDYQYAARKERPVRTIYRTAKFADDRHVWVNHGDDNGVVMLAIDGKPGPVNAYQARYRFEMPGKSYQSGAKVA